MIPEVAAIIPTFNRRDMVVEAIASVLAQRDVQFELIVVDDGSTDGTDDAIEQIVDSTEAPVRVIQTENRGAAAARNIGVEAAQAPLIAFLDSDDLWHPEKLSHQLWYLRDHPEFEIAQCNEIWIRDGRRVNPAMRHLKREGDIFIDSLRTCLISPSAVIIKTKLFDDMGGFDEEMVAAEDYDLWLRILIDRKAGLLDENLVTRHSGHADQLSSQTAAIDRYRILALTKLLTSANLVDAKRAATAEVLAEKCGIYARGLRRRGRDAGLIEEIAERAVRDWIHAPDKALVEMIPKLRTLVASRNP